MDAQRRAASRGLGDLQADAGTQGLRDTVDYGLSREDLLRQQTRGHEDLTLQRDRGFKDIDRNLQALHRGFTIQGDQQRQSINAATMGSAGGAAIQAAAKRAANEAWDRQPLDTQRARLANDFTRDSARLDQDAGSQLGHLALMGAPPDAGNPMGGRSFQDRTTALTRAGREDVQFGLDIGAQKTFQATQAGWVPPPAPLSPQAQFAAHQRSASAGVRRARSRARRY